MKGGTPQNRYQEPFNELAATRLCGRILEPCDFVPYRLVNEGYLRWTSLCPCMEMPADQPRPFMRNLDRQVPRWVRGHLDWLSLDTLEGFTTDIEEVLEGNSLVATELNRIDAICTAVEGRIAGLRVLLSTR